MSSIARNHHYVSQFYLQGFLDPNLQGQGLHIIDKINRRHFVSTPRRVAYERDFNRINVPDHDMDEVESHLAQIEAQAATVLKDIAQKATLPQKDRDMDILIVFAGILAANNPQIRDSLINIDEENTRQMRQSKVENREAYESRLSECGLEDLIGYDVARALVESGNCTIEYPEGYYLARVFDALDRVVLPLFSNMLWSLVIAETGANDFICSDRPVFLFRNVDLIPCPQPAYTITPSGLILPNETPPTGFAVENLELTMPVNPRMAIYATTPGNPSPIEYGDQMTIACINKRTIDAAARQIYCPNLDFKFLEGGTIRGGRDLVDE